jgi:hypothetical protein
MPEFPAQAILGPVGWHHVGVHDETAKLTGEFRTKNDTCIPAYPTQAISVMFRANL